MLADYFLVEELKTFALEKFKSKVKERWVSEAFVNCIGEIYSHTEQSYSGLRSAAVEVARTHLTELWVKSPFQKLLRAGGDFAVDLMAGFAEPQDDIGGRYM